MTKKAVIPEAIPTMEMPKKSHATDWYMPEDHSIYSIYHRSMRNVTVSNLVRTLVSYFKCPGITYITNDTKIYCHVIPLNSDI